ncbi:hypothetical protein BGX28_001701 [Mortierella sp. GBA30]|nr:hypothetical protein BGX28_001701 [Mortierella sp. GBA30]
MSLICFLDLVLLLFFFHVTVTPADGASPIPASTAAFATTNGTFYVQGGIVGATLNGNYILTDQFFGLDLTQNWSTSNPPWKAIYSATTTMPPKTWGHSMTVIDDKLLLWATQPYGQAVSGIMTYLITDNIWLPTLQPLPNAYTTFWKLKAATDPSTGMVYVPSGKDNGTSMAVYGNMASVSVSMPPPEIMTSPLSYYSVVWSTERNTLLIYGGLKYEGVITAGGIGLTGNPNLVEFSPRSLSWARISTKGESPGDISSHCMVPAYNGTKMVVFGGITITRQPVASIYILDLGTLTWTRGKDADPLQRRSDMACTVAGDNFIAWGGEYLGKRMESFGTPLIYNLQTGQWITEFNLTPASATNSTPPFDPLPSAKNSNAAAIGGGIGGVLLVIFASLFIYKFNRSRQRKRQSGQNIPVEYNNPQRSEEGIVSGNLITTSSAPHSMSKAEAYKLSPCTTSHSQYSPTTMAGPQYSPSENAAYYPPPSDATGYAMPPIMIEKGDAYHDGGSQRYRQNSGYEARTNSRPSSILRGSTPVWSPQAIPEQEKNPTKRANNPQYQPETHSTVPGQDPAQIRGSDYNSNSNTCDVNRIQHQIALIEQQQEKQYQMQQDLEHLRLEQQEQLQILQQQLKSKSS